MLFSYDKPFFLTTFELNLKVFKDFIFVFVRNGQQKKINVRSRLVKQKTFTFENFYFLGNVQT